MEPVEGRPAVAESRAALADAPDSSAACLDLVQALTAQADAEPDPDDRAGQADEPIELLRTAAALEDENLPIVLVQLTALLYWRCTARAAQGAPTAETTADRDEGIAHFGRLWHMAVAGDVVPEFVAGDFPVVQRVIDLLLQRAQRSRDPADVDTAITYGSAVLAARPEPESPDIWHACTRYQLAQAYVLRPDAQPDAIGHLRVLLAMPPDLHPWHDEATAMLGPQLAQWIARDPGRRGADVAEALDVLRQAEELTATIVEPTFDPAVARAMFGYWQGLLRLLRYAALGGTEDDFTQGSALLTGIIEIGGPQPFADVSRVTLMLLRDSTRLPARLREILGTSTPSEFLLELRAVNPDLRATEAEAAEFDRQLAGLSDEFWQHPDAEMFGRFLRTLSVLGTGVGDRTPEELARAYELLAGIETHEDDGDTLMTILRETLGVHRANKLRDPGEHLRAQDELFDTARRIGPDHPMRRLVEDALAFSTTAIDARPTSAAGIAETVLRLERVLTELPDDHPDRARTISDIAVTLLRTTTTGKPPVPLGRVYTLLLEALERPTTDEMTVTLTVLVGWFEGVRGMLDDDVEPVRTSIERYRAAARLLRPEHPLARAIDIGLAMSLMQRSIMDGSIEDMDAATYYSRRIRFKPSEMSTDPTRMLNAIAGYWRNRGRLDAESMDRFVEARDQAMAMLRPGQPDTGTDVLRLLLHPEGQMDFPTDGPRLADFVTAADELTTGLADRSPDDLGYTEDRTIAAMVNIGAGFAARDLAVLDRGLDMLAADTPRPVRRRLRRLAGLGGGLLMRFVLSHHRDDVDRAIETFEAARALVDEHPHEVGTSDVAALLGQLGECYMARSDVARQDRAHAVATGLAGLRGRVRDVLVQTGAERALATAMSATDEAAEVTRWCVQAGDAESAVRALEIGRGTVLYAATVDAGLPALLREGGHPELADRWQREVGSAGSAPWDASGSPDDRGLPIPSDLRRQVFTVMEGTAISARLFTPPGPADIGAGLRDAAAEALVYLVPGNRTLSGLAVLVAADGTVRAEMLPRLRRTPGDPVEIFQRSQRALLTTTDDEATHGRWSAALRGLCDWAWSVAMGPVLERMVGVRPGRPARVVLVPVGVLGAVPWHAARRPVAGGPRYAGQDAILSYAASARQFLDAVGRGHRPWPEQPALARVLDSDLHWDRREMAEIQAHCYPGATVLGADTTPVRPCDVIGLLPGPDGDGASVLHLGAHGDYAPVPVDSGLVLDGGNRLHVRDVLRHARDRPANAPGGLVVLATCVSDLTDNAYDEALTLASTFLAAGSAGVVGTRWPVDDLPTALFMIMFHHYLNFGYPNPATALRATQQWMLNPDRTLPPDISRKLVGPMRRADLAAVRNWAGFTYQGQ